MGAIVVFALALVYFASALFNRPFHTRGEAREAIVVQAMLQEHNYVLPLRNGLDIPSKPPMFHWTAAALSNLWGGADEAPIRFTSALYGALALAIVFPFIAAESGIGAAALCTIMLATTFEWARSATGARVDMCFTFWVIATLLALFQALNAVDAERGRQWFWYSIAAIACMGSILAKGPAGLLLPGAIATLYFLIAAPRPLLRSIVRFPFAPAIIAVMLAVAGASIWYYLAYQMHGERFLKVQLVDENFSRVVETDGDDRGHKGSFLIVPLLFAQGFLPWSLLLPFPILWLWKERGELRANKTALFSAVWLSVFIAVVMVSVSKRIVYLLPAFPAAAYLMYLSLNAAYVRTAKTLGYVITTLGVVASSATIGIFCISKFGVGVLPASAQTKLLRLPETEPVLKLFSGSNLLVICFGMATVLIIIAGWNFLSRRIKPGAFALGLGLLGIHCTVNDYIMPVVAELNTARDFAAQARATIPSDKPIFQFDHQFYPAIYYLGRNLIPFDSKKDSTNVGEAYVFVTDDDLSRAQQLFPQATTLFESTNRAAEGRNKIIVLHNPA